MAALPSPSPLLAGGQLSVDCMLGGVMDACIAWLTELSSCCEAYVRAAAADDNCQLGQRSRGL